MSVSNEYYEIKKIGFREFIVFDFTKTKNTIHYFTNLDEVNAKCERIIRKLNS